MSPIKRLMHVRQCEYRCLTDILFELFKGFLLILPPLEPLVASCHSMERCSYNLKGSYELLKVLCCPQKTPNFNDICSSRPLSGGLHLCGINLKFSSTNHIPQIHQTLLDKFTFLKVCQQLMFFQGL